MDEFLYGNPEVYDTLREILSEGRFTPIRKSQVKHFAPKTDLPIYDSVLQDKYEDKTRNKFAVAFARVSLDEFINIQATILGMSPSDFMTENDPHFIKEHAEEKLRKPFNAGNLPVPYLEFNSNGDMKNHQEGRHRAYLAKEAGHSTIDVLLAVNA